MMSRAWMPLYTGDYRRDTAHLRTIEHGAYLLLIMYYWDHGGLPQDERHLPKIVNMRPSTFARMRSTLAAFFEPGWKHKRIDQELEKAEIISTKRRLAALKRGDINAARLRANGRYNPSKSTHSHISKKERGLPRGCRESLEDIVKRKGWVDSK